MGLFSLHKRVSPQTRRDSICVLCRSHAVGRTGLCERCAASLPAAPEARTYDGLNVQSAFPFEEPLRGLIHTYKYQNGRYLARLFARSIAERCTLDPSCVLVAVPLHPARVAERGFSQTDLLCRMLSAQTGMPMLDSALLRLRNTLPQTGLTRTERLENLSGAFFSHQVTNDRFILVDDVVTTGATLCGCAEALKEGGAAHVQAVTVCMAVNGYEGGAGQP